jgi:hypothetical protein
VLLTVARADHLAVSAGHGRVDTIRLAGVLAHEEACRLVRGDAVAVGDEQDDIFRTVLAFALELFEAVLHRGHALLEPTVVLLRWVGIIV